MNSSFLLVNYLNQSTIISLYDLHNHRFKYIQKQILTEVWTLNHLADGCPDIRTHKNNFVNVCLNKTKYKVFSYYHIYIFTLFCTLLPYLTEFLLHRQTLKKKKVDSMELRIFADQLNISLCRYLNELSSCLHPLFASNTTI